jgi:hypothetical protein
MGTIDPTVTTQPSAARQLKRLMAVLRREAAPRRGKLTAVRAMASQHDDGPADELGGVVFVLPPEAG